MEHKTGKEIDYEHYLMFDDQHLHYALAIAITHRPDYLSMVYNFLTTSSAERITFPITRGMLKPVWSSLKNTLSEIGKLPIYPDIDITCSWQC